MTEVLALPCAPMTNGKLIYSPLNRRKEISWKSDSFSPLAPPSRLMMAQDSFPFIDKTIFISRNSRTYNRTNNADENYSKLMVRDSNWLSIARSGAHIKNRSCGKPKEIARDKSTFCSSTRVIAQLELCTSGRDGIKNSRGQSKQPWSAISFGAHQVRSISPIAFLLSIKNETFECRSSIQTAYNLQSL